MKVRELVEKLGLQVFNGGVGLDNEVLGGYTSDLLSDVMGNIEEGSVWITLQTHKNIVAIASLRDISAVILVKGLKPEEAALFQSRLEGVALLGSDLQAFELSGKIYQLLNQ